MTKALPKIGELYLLPPEPDQEGDKDHRPHMVLSRVMTSSATVTLAYCSSQATEADLGAQAILVEPSAPAFAATGLNRPTYIYPSRLVVIEPEELTQYPRIGKLEGTLLGALRGSALPRAIGYLAGTCRDPGLAAGSLRGAVLQFSPTGRDRVGSGYAVVVTDPVFSRQHESLNVIPVLDADETTSQYPDLTFENRDWIAPLGGIKRALVFTRLVQAIRVKPDVSRLLPPHADAETMREIDLAMRSIFLTPDEIAAMEAPTPLEEPTSPE